LNKQADSEVVSLVAVPHRASWLLALLTGVALSAVAAWLLSVPTKIKHGGLTTQQRMFEVEKKVDHNDAEIIGMREVVQRLEENAANEVSREEFDRRMALINQRLDLSQQEKSRLNDRFGHLVDRLIDLKTDSAGVNGDLEEDAPESTIGR